MNLLVTLTIFAVLSLHVVDSRRRSKPVRPSQEMCLSGDGSSYRGYVSESAKGRKCLNWNQFSNPWGESKGVGSHHYCRNPDQSLMPWCRVKRGWRYVREFCRISKCQTPTVNPPPAIDTELTCGDTRSEERRYKIVGGSFAPIESHPWVAAIFYRRGHFLCGGSLIAPCWVLTAAHCFSNGLRSAHLTVYLGKTAINETDAAREQNFTVEKLIVHQDYNESSFNNDIALLKIRSSDGRCAVKSTSTRTVCLPPSHTRLPSGFQCSIAGFGKETFETWQYSQYLKKAEVKLISQTECKSDLYYGEKITKNMICAGSRDWSTDACKGDSGGPLVCNVADRMFLFGVVSWGDGCAKKNNPGVYTKVTNYNDWIATNTGLSEYTKGVMYPPK